MSNTKNDIAWNKIFQKFDILGHIQRDSLFVIQASHIAEYREPRLMTKFDSFEGLPSIFKQNNLSILPISRGSYIISNFETFCKFPKFTKDLCHFSFPSNIQSITISNIFSESVALNCLYISGILSDFLEDENLWPTLCGRMGTEEFEFQIDNRSSKLSISVDRSQIEIDGTYEGEHFISIIEAKNQITDDFNIRQLYYPYRTLFSKFQKPIKTIFIVYSNDIFRLYEYMFTDPNNYNSIFLAKQKNYVVSDSLITFDDIHNILLQSKHITKKGIPFPQADSFERVINVVELLHGKESVSKDFFTEYYQFDPRQSDYYLNAAIFIGLITKDKSKSRSSYRLSTLGKKILQLPYKQRQIVLIQQILTDQIFIDSLKIVFDSGKFPTKEHLVSVMSKSKIYNMFSEITMKRRASTVDSWLHWIVNTIDND